eukprot:5256945-Amphidinium_carterae.1
MAEVVSPEEVDGHRSKDNAWYCRMYGLWKQKRVATHPCLAISDVKPSRPSEEVNLIRKHWEPVFSHEPLCMDRVADIVGNELLDDMLAFVPPIAWNRVVVDPQSISDVLMASGPSAAGPDEITYAMLKPIAPEIAVIAHDWFQEACLSATLPTQLAEMAMVFLPKQTCTNMGAQGLRPISLLNTLCKLPCAVVARSLLVASEMWVSPLQHGFASKRDCASALAALESGVMTSAGSCSSGCVFLADLCQAFPSTRRDWVRLVLKRSGITDSWYNFFYAILGPKRCTLQWRRSSWSAFSICEGLLQ